MACIIQQRSYTAGAAAMSNKETQPRRSHTLTHFTKQCSRAPFTEDMACCRRQWVLLVHVETDPFPFLSYSALSSGCIRDIIKQKSDCQPNNMLLFGEEREERDPNTKQQRGVQWVKKQMYGSKHMRTHAHALR